MKWILSFLTITLSLFSASSQPPCCIDCAVKGLENACTEAECEQRPTNASGTSSSFTDIISGLTFEIPSGYVFNEAESQTDSRQNNWWYTFHDRDQNVLTVEIEEYDSHTSLPEHFHAALTTAEDRESVMYEKMEFRHIEVNGLPITKWELRILALSDSQIEPLYFCDYLFVRDCFGFCINLIKKENSPPPMEQADEMMLSLIQSIRFH